MRDKLSKYLESKGFPEGDGLLSNLKSHRYPVGGYSMRTPDLPVYVVGDAGGLAEAVTGEGIFAALQSGRIAGEVLCAVHAGRGVPKDYYRRLKTTVLVDTYLSYQAARLFYRNTGGWINFLANPLIWRPFALGLAEGRTLAQSFLFSFLYFVQSFRRGGDRVQIKLTSTPST